MKARHAACLLGLLNLLCVALPAAAVEPRRIAVVIGNNTGASDEDSLAYAESDAARVGDLLVRLAGVAEEDLLLVRGASADSAERVLGEVRNRIAAERAARATRPVMLFVYYSGHASVGALHLGATRLGFDRLERLVKEAGAHVSVLVVDACRSGGMTRVKGATPAAPFEIRVEDKLDSAGTAIITSSALGEDAQESDRLRGGIFTHHLVGGLMGAADTSQDGQVTLAEAYRYAYDQTLRTTSRTRFVQHPTFAFRLEGRQDLVLTRLAAGAGMGRLHLAQGGFYMVLDRDHEGSAVAEFEAQAGSDVVLRHGRYLVRRRTPQALDEGMVTVPDGGQVALQASAMRRVPYGQTVRRGMRERSTWRMGADAGVTAAVLPGQSPTLLGGLAVGLDLEAATVLFGLRYGHASAANSDVALDQHMVGAELTGLRLFDLPRVPMAIGLGVRGGVDWFAQRFSTAGLAPDRDQVAGHVGPLLRVEAAPTARMAISLDLGLDAYAFRVARESEAVWDARVAPFARLGWSWYLP